jgi:predicted glycosyltransferase
MAYNNLAAPDELLVKASLEPVVPVSKRIWIDLDNSPHVPFFAPIIKELEKRRYSITLTAREAYQVSELVDLFGLTCKKLGRHYGKNKFLKVFGVCIRALQLIPLVLREKPDLALSHGSRAQLLTSFLLGIPSVTIFDYEHVSQGLMWLKPSWVIVPEVIPDDAVKHNRQRILRYRGIKEDVYVPGFKPNPMIKAQLGLTETDLVVTIRPPANEAHYHRPQSDELFHAVVTHLTNQPDVKMIVLPRNVRQESAIRGLWSNLILSGKMIIPKHVVDGLNLIWYSDLVVSGGGTMNREAAALGVPVYSIFRGKIGSVDRYLADKGRLVLLEKVEEVKTKIKLTPWHRAACPESTGRFAMQDIVNEVTSILRANLSAQRQGVQ